MMVPMTRVLAKSRRREVIRREHEVCVRGDLGDAHGRVCTQIGRENTVKEVETEGINLDLPQGKDLADN
jgi:hypothetical protein